MDQLEYNIFREIVDTIETTYREFLREGDHKDRRETRIVFYNSMLQVFVEDPLSEVLQKEVVEYLRDKIHTAADPYTDWVKKVFLVESVKKVTKK